MVELTIMVDDKNWWFGVDAFLFAGSTKSETGVSGVLRTLCTMGYEQKIWSTTARRELSRAHQ
jgi:hypothetical protein